MTAGRSPNPPSSSNILTTPFPTRRYAPPILRPELLPAERYPAVHGWLARLKARPSFEAAFFFDGMDASTGAVQQALQGGGA